MKTYFLNRLFLLASLVIFAGVATSVSALSKNDIEYPITELGACKNESDCKLFCDKPKNVESCLVFAEKYNLLSRQEIQKSKKALAVTGGPGGCSGRECEAYCNDTAHITECLDFAEKNDMMPPEELAEGRRVQAALARGATLPGGCKTKSECDNYCNDSSHMEECVTFAEAAGFIPPDELAEAKKVLAAIRNGAKPPPCGNKKSCDAYCGEPAHFEQCLTFAEAAGLIAPQELAEAKKVLYAIQKGVKPPACSGREECDVYCQEPEHAEECINFAEAAGFMSSKDAEMARKTGGKGPGGCRGQNECEQFCQNPDNQETCFLFAKEHGLISEEDLQKMNEGARQIQNTLNQAPPEIRDCLVQAVGQNKLDKIMAGDGMMSPDIGDAMRLCFESMMPPNNMGQQEEGMRGPGGCQTPEECAGAPPHEESRGERGENERRSFTPPPNNEHPYECASAEECIQLNPPFELERESLPPIEPREQTDPNNLYPPVEQHIVPPMEQSPPKQDESPSSAEPSSSQGSSPDLGANLLLQAEKALRHFIGFF